MTKDEFRSEVDALVSIQTIPVSERNARVEVLCERYLTANGFPPPNDELNRLGEWIMHEAITSRNKHLDEYPVYTEEQLAYNDRRHGVKVSLDALDESLHHLLEHIEWPTALYAQTVQERVQDAVRENPEMSNRQIAKIVGVSHTIVGKYRRAMQKRGGADE